MAGPIKNDNPFINLAIGLGFWLFTVGGIAFIAQHGTDAVSRRLLTCVMWGDLPISLVVGWIAGQRMQRTMRKK